MKNAFRNAVQYSCDKARYLIRTTPVEIPVGALILGAVFGGVSYHLNAAKEGNIPIAFSEIGKTIQEFQAQGKPVPPLTKYYASLNDVLMKVFEANNIALESNRSHNRFATELEFKVDPAFRVHRLIGDYAREMPSDARAALQSISRLSEAGKDIPQVTSALSNAWKADHTDVTRTKRWTETECDANRENCKEVEHSEEVYDYTIHSYTYDHAFGEKSDQSIRYFLNKHPNLNLEEKLHFSRKTDVENEYAIERSMKEKLSGKIPTQAESLQYANMWAFGSTLMKYLPVINDNHAGLSRSSPAWSSAKTTAKSVTYNTTSQDDDGPREYQIAQTALDQAQKIHHGINAIASGIQLGGYAVPALNEKIHEYVGVVLDKKPGNPDKLRSEIMQIATTTYKRNFEDGLDVQPFKWEQVLLLTLLGAGLGGLAGAGLDRYGNKSRFSSRRFP